MMFDKLAKWAETEAPEYKTRVDAARLFVVPEVYTSFVEVEDKPRIPWPDDLPTSWDDEFRVPSLSEPPDPALIERFELPFEVIAIERGWRDAGSDDPDETRPTCVLLSRASDPQVIQFVVVRTSNVREVLAGCVRIGQWDSFYVDGPMFLGLPEGSFKMWDAAHSRRMTDGVKREFAAKVREWDATDSLLHGATVGALTNWEKGVERQRESALECAIERGAPEEELADIRSERPPFGNERKSVAWSHDITRYLIEPVEIALQTVLKINDPSRIVLREERLDARPPQEGRIWRSNQRPLYTAIDRREARTVIPRLARTGGSKGPVAHERRGHWRRLPEDEVRLPNKHGQLVWVKPCWIGPTEAIVENKRYRVYLEPESSESNRREVAS